MSLVVEQTLPYTNTQLQLEDSKRWIRLFSLMRPSTKVFETANGQSIVVDTALATSKGVLIAAIGSIGNFSTKILSEARLAAFTTEQFGKSSTTAEDIAQILKENGYPTENGVVVVRAASKTDLRAIPGLVDLGVVGELKLDHVLSLLSATKPEIQASFEKTQALLEHFIKSAARTTSTFHERKGATGPQVIHAVDVAEFSSAKAAINKDLGNLFSSRPSLGGDLVYSTHYSDVNGLSKLESNILAHEISEYFAKKKLSSYITHSTILTSHSQARGWAISFVAVPAIFLEPQPDPSNTLETTSTATSTIKPREGTFKIKLSEPQIRRIITAGCESVIKDEPKITEYDTIVGDGDCGYTLRDGAQQVLQFIGNADLNTLPSTLSTLVDDLEVNMGGTSGALYCIFLSSLAHELWEAPTFPDALKGALEQLMKYTTARLGDRTCMDCLIPFVESLLETRDAKKALTEARNGVETTKKMEAKLGRSSYLDENATRGVPDPGAYGLLKLLEGMVGAQ